MLVPILALWFKAASRLLDNFVIILKFIYSEKDTKFGEISTLDLSYVVPVKFTVEILQKLLSSLEYMNFKNSVAGYFFSL